MLLLDKSHHLAHIAPISLPRCRHIPPAYTNRPSFAEIRCLPPPPNVSKRNICDSSQSHAHSGVVPQTVEACCYKSPPSYSWVLHLVSHSTAVNQLSTNSPRVLKVAAYYHDCSRCAPDSPERLWRGHERALRQACTYSTVWYCTY